MYDHGVDQGRRAASSCSHQLPAELCLSCWAEEFRDRAAATENPFTDDQTTSFPPIPCAPKFHAAEGLRGGVAGDAAGGQAAVVAGAEVDVAAHVPERDRRVRVFGVSDL